MLQNLWNLNKSLQIFEFQQTAAKAQKSKQKVNKAITYIKFYKINEIIQFAVKSVTSLQMIPNHKKTKPNAIRYLTSYKTTLII